MPFADTRERHAAYEAALRGAGIEPDPQLVFHASDMDQAGGVTAAAALLAAGVPCSALCVATDQNAVSLIAALQGHGYRIGQDLAVTGFDDLEISALISPSLTTVQQNNEEIGAAATRLVMAMLAGKSVPVQRFSVPTVPVYRQSCGCRLAQDTAPEALVELSEDQSWAAHVQETAFHVASQSASALPDRAAAQLRCALARCVEALGVVLEGGSLPLPGALADAFRAMLAAAGSLEAVNRGFGLMQAAATARATHVQDAAIADRVAGLLGEMRAELVYAARVPYVQSFLEAQQSTHVNYFTSLALLEPQKGSPRDLAWLCETPVQVGFLGLWKDDAPGSALNIVGSYQRAGTSQGLLGESCRPGLFPPLTLFGELPDDPHLMVMVVPVQTAERDWGALALLCEVERQSTSVASAVRQWSILLAAALERERLQSLEAEAREAAERLARTRSEFLASVSHELRTPLTAMVGYSDLLLSRWEGLDEATRQDYARRILASAKRQQRLVEDLLLVSKVEANALDVRHDVVDVPALVAQAADDLRVVYVGQEVLIHGPDELHAIADSMRLSQILANLLDNAAKYSEEGSSIEVSWSQEGPMCVVRVRDRGSGVPLAGREQLFRQFGRMPGSKIRSGKVGTGLGPFLGRQLAQLMGGALDLEETGPSGSCFRLAIPARDVVTLHS
jgi:signal transduction histidine kinase